jgi:hypothetical protein
MNSILRKTMIPMAAGAALVLGAAGPASASTQIGDGLVNVQVGDITIEDAVDVQVAAQVAANICGVDVGPIAVLGNAVDADGADRVVCTTDQGQRVLLTN